MNEFDRENIVEKNKILKEKMIQLEIERKKIQGNFKFKIPIYVLDEIIKLNNMGKKNNLNVMINLAIVNNRISSKEARILKDYYIFNNNK